MLVLVNAKWNYDELNYEKNSRPVSFQGGTPTGRSFSMMSYGVCLPVGCHTKSVVKYVRAMLSGQHLQAAWDADVSIRNCDEAGTPIVRPMGYYIYM